MIVHVYVHADYSISPGGGRGQSTDTLEARADTLSPSVFPDFPPKPVLCRLLLLWLCLPSSGGLRASRGPPGQTQELLQLLRVHVFAASEHVALGIAVTPQLMELDL